MLSKSDALSILSQFVLVRDFDHFTDRSFFELLWDKGTSKNDLMWSTSLFTIKGGNNWRLVRQTLNPTFTLSKMKMMLQGSSDGFLNKCFYREPTKRLFLGCVDEPSQLEE